MERFSFDDKASFVKKLEDLVTGGTPKGKIDTFTPYHVHEAEHILHTPASNVRVFTTLGATVGFLAGWALTIGTVLDWPLITGGKPHASIPAFLVIAYELTILFGCLFSFVGFLYFARAPKVENLWDDKKTFDRPFQIVVQD